MPRHHVDPGIKALRVLARRQIGLLKLNRINKRSQTRYRAAIRRFHAWCWQYGYLDIDNVDALDTYAQEFIEALWQEGDSKGDAGLLLSALQWALQQKRILPGSWGLFKAWSLLELPRRAPPLPAVVLTGLVGFALSEGRLGLAATLLAGFAGFLRTAELTSLSASQLTFSDSGCLVLLPLTKSGQRRGGPETVHITDPQAVQLLWLATAHSTDRAEPLTGMHPQMFRRWFRQALETLGVTAMGFLPYSVRRGGATHAYQQQPNLPHVLLIGRWEESKTARIYITEGALFLTKLSLPAEALRLAQSYTTWLVQRLQVPH